jgi:hypothetical protein
MQPIAPMTLGNMRANGVRTLAAWCLGRGSNHFRVLDVSGYAGDVPLPSFGPRLSLGIACNLFNSFHDATPQLGVFNLHECFRERESIGRGEEIGYKGR